MRKRRNKTALKRRRKRERQLELLTLEILHILADGICAFCLCELDTEPGVKVADGAWDNDRLLWSEVGLSHQNCFDDYRQRSMNSAPRVQ